MQMHACARFLGHEANNPFVHWILPYSCASSSGSVLLHERSCQPGVDLLKHCVHAGFADETLMGEPPPLNQATASRGRTLSPRRAPAMSAASGSKRKTCKPAGLEEESDDDHNLPIPVGAGACAPNDRQLGL